ncbi:MAG: glutathione S-transferase C-terminal domain-containing protein [Candidatus Sericytochromatia bacterium]|nr:glutathione S-transferase C-terminal domain-containing protein [Candidatus Tanganyikabacteria bacterium]
MRGQFPAEQAAGGRFVRQQDAFRGWVSADGSSGYPLESGRYHLYVSWACPWAHRTILARRLMGLDAAVGMTAVDPVRDERGWAFRDGPDISRDPVNDFAFLGEAYLATDPDYRARVTVPVLWDIPAGRIASNSDDDILRMFGTVFRPLGSGDAPDLYPEPYRAEIDSLNYWLYDRVNDGVYRAGFATRQESYEEAAWRLFAALDALEGRLADRKFLIADWPVETDWRLFTTLIRFDPVYHGHFKCNLRRIADYPHLHRYMRDLYHVPGVADTVKFDQIKRHYYYTHVEINPTRIVPIGPAQEL